MKSKEGGACVRPGGGVMFIGVRGVCCGVAWSAYPSPFVVLRDSRAWLLLPRPALATTRSGQGGRSQEKEGEGDRPQPQPPTPLCHLIKEGGVGGGGLRIGI